MLVVRNCEGDQRPKSRGMVELPEMTELVHDEVVGEMRRQERELVAEVQIALARAAPPASALVANADAVVGEEVRWRECGIEARKMLEPRMRGGTCGFFVQGKSAATRERGWARCPAAARVPTDTSHDSSKRIDPYSPPDDPEEWHSVDIISQTPRRTCIIF